MDLKEVGTFWGSKCASAFGCDGAGKSELIHNINSNSHSAMKILEILTN